MALKLEVTFHKSHLQRARSPSVSHWGEVCGLGTFDCEGFFRTICCVNSSAKAHPSFLVRRDFWLFMLARLGKMEVFSQPSTKRLRLPLERRAVLYLHPGWIITLKKQMVIRLLF